MKYPGLFVVVGVVCLLGLMPPGSAEEAKENEPEPAGVTNVTQTVQGESNISIQAMCTNCNSADLAVGSFGNEFIHMTCDGLPVPPGLAQIYLLSVVPPTTIDNVAVEKGAGRAQLSAGAIGGEIEIRRRPFVEGWTLNAGLDHGESGWNGSRLDFSGRKGWFGASVVGSTTQTDSIDEDGDGNPEVGAIDRQTLEGRFDFELGRRQNLRLGVHDYEESQNDARAAYDFISTLIEGTPRWNLEAVELERDQQDAVYETRFRDGGSLTASLLHARRKTSIEETVLIFVGTYLPSYDIAETNRHAALTWVKPLSTGAMLRAGWSQTEGDFDITDYTALSGIPVDDREQLTERGLWVEGEFNLTSDVNFFAGLRWVDFDYVDTEDNPAWLVHPLPQDNKVLPRLALNWKPSDPLNLRFSAGVGLRQPPAAFEEVCCGRRYRGNRGIRMEESKILGFEANWQPRSGTYDVGLSVFRTWFDDRIVKMVTQSFQYRPNYQNVNVPSAQLANLSLDGSYTPTSWFNMRASATWTDAQNRTAGGEIPALIDFFSTPLEVSYFSEELPYVPSSVASVSAQFLWSAPSLIFDLSWQRSGSMTIQQWDPAQFDPLTGGDSLSFTETPDFSVYNARLTQLLPGGIQLFLGVDNIGDYVQDDIASPNSDYTWGPLRGRYYYLGTTFNYSRRR